MSTDVRVSVIVPAYNVEAWIDEALASVLVQTEASIEVVAVDNGSSDGTGRRLAAWLERDARVRVLRSARVLGPAGGRNLAIEAARGEWIALLDADDRMHPRRLESMLAAAERCGAAIIADNQNLITEDGVRRGLMWPELTRPEWVNAPAFVRANRWGGPRRYGLGYAKPLFRRDCLDGVRYDTRLRIAEDFHFLLALLARGERMLMRPEALYDYTLRTGSISRTLSEDDLLALLRAGARTRSRLTDGGLRAALKEHQHALDRMLAHERIVGALKAWRPDRAVAVALRRPEAVPMVAKTAWRGLAKRLLRQKGAEGPVIYFGPNAKDSAVIRRIRGFEAAGLPVIGFTFQRETVNRSLQPDWNNVPLGTTQDRNYRGRARALVAACRPVWEHRAVLRGASMICARNIDMAVLALFARLVARSKAPVVYEVLDVQQAFLGGGLGARLLRWLERRVLARMDLLAVSSPGFVREYFAPRQGYRGDWFLIENKVLGPQIDALAPKVTPVPAALPPERRRGRIVIGWHGTLRCPTSLTMLEEVCRALPDKVLLYMRGVPTETGLDPFLAVVRRNPNMIYGGEYFSPRDLPEIYAEVDLCWCFDYLHPADNSLWLLPNRLYDGGYFGVPALAAAGTETGHMVDGLGLGWTFPAPVTPVLIDFLRGLAPETLADKRRSIARLPRSLFRDETDGRRLHRAVTRS